jgi:putative membrane protein
MNRALRLASLLAGVAVVLWLLAQADLSSVLGFFPHIGWGFVLILLARAGTIAIDAAAWNCLLAAAERPCFRSLLTLRWIGESINTTLPVGQIGGDVVRARLLQRRLRVPARGAASVMVDFSLSLLGQLCFTLLGFALLRWLAGGTSWWPIALGAAMLPIVAMASWKMLSRRRLLAATEALALRLGQARLAASLQALSEALGSLSGSRAALARAMALHACSYVANAAELWLTLSLMGVPTDFIDAVLLESLSLAARSAAFLIPSGWGAQEASLVALAGIAGLSADSALALGLVKRAREFGIALPGLAAWAVAEHRRPSRRDQRA